MDIWIFSVDLLFWNLFLWVLFQSHSDLFSSLVSWGAYLDFFFNVHLNAHFDLLSSSSLVQLKCFCVGRDLFRKRAHWKQGFGLKRLHWYELEALLLLFSSMICLILNFSVALCWWVLKGALVMGANLFMTITISVGETNN